MKQPPHRLERITDIRLIQRLLSKVEENDQGCWVWSGHTDRKGYGQIKFDGRAHWAHRVAYAVFKGPISKGMTIHHTCLNCSCVNPGHLEEMSRAENSRERAARGHASHSRSERASDSTRSHASDEDGWSPPEFP